MNPDMVLTGNALAQVISRVLGINIDKVNSITIEAEAGKVAAVYIKRYITEIEANKIVSELTKYNLVAREVDYESSQ